MSTAGLKFCLQAVTTLTEEDLAAVTEGVESYTAGGMSAKKAEAAAVSDALALVERERATIIELAREQHPSLFGAPSRVDEAANQAATSPTNDLPEPTPAQKEAGNYKMGHTRLHGLAITIENPRGSERRAVDGSWVVPSMPAHYGYIKRTEGADGDHVDVFIGQNPESTTAWVINQKHTDGAFDEHKVMLGFDSADDAKAAYLASFTDGWGAKVFESISAPMDIDALKATLPRLEKAKPVKRASLAGKGQQIPNRPAPAKNADLDAAALLADEDMKAALGDLGDIIGAKFRASLTPEQRQKLLPVMARLFEAAFRKGLVEFRRAARTVLAAIRAALGPAAADAITIDDLQAGYIMASQGKDGATPKRDVVSVETKDELEAPDVSGGDPDLERDSGDAGAGDAPVGDAVSSDGPADGPVITGVPAGSRRSGPEDGAGLPDARTPPSGERGDQPVSGGDGQAGLAFSAPGDSDSLGGGRPGGDGIQPDREAGGAAPDAAQRELAALEKLARQKAAQSVAIIPGDLANIRESLPYLLPGQQEDVLKAETRFAKPAGYGMLFTNSTGTGKTYSGLGIVKRFERQGKRNTLIVVPDEKIMSDWVVSARALQLTVTPLVDTKDGGKGITITTYANMQANHAIVKRDWDLIVPDEAHQLMQAADGVETLALAKLRAIALHPNGVYARARSLHDKLFARSDDLNDRSRAARKRYSEAARDGAPTDALAQEIKTLDAQLNEVAKEVRAAVDAVKADVAARQGEKRPRAVFLSATPFAYVKTIDWAEGFLFSYMDGYPYDPTSLGYNDPSPYNYFFITRFGYRMRVGKLTQPEANVDSGLMERQFNTWLKTEGVLSNRQLEVDADYDRRFILAESAVGNEIDRAIEWISDKSREQDATGFRMMQDTLRDRLFGKNGHLLRRYLLEAIKAKEAVAHIRAHLAMGRKVVVFHDFKKGGAINPFRFMQAPQIPAQAGMTPEQLAALADQNASRAAMNAAIEEFDKAFPELASGTLLSDLSSPIERFTREFPDVLLINGDEKKSALLQRYKTFNDDSVGPIVALVQSDKNKGWSGHDTTGRHQRVLINLGLPTQPTKTIQTEGRIYRTGQVSNAIMRYLNTGTNWERWAFAETIAQRASTAENLSSGEAARALKDAFIAAFEESGDFPAGHEGEGTGGKARDAATNNVLDAFDRAISFYFGTQKKNAKTKAQEGVDYFATPEPLGLKMVEWADIRHGEDVLEPSAGHGAIARWFPDNVTRTAIEPSGPLGSRMALVFDGKVIRDTFENLHVVNKYDAIVMNPPFGVGGKTAIEHLAKAATHLNPGGRIVALIPTGPAADKRFDKWFYEEETRPAKPLATHPTAGPIYRGDTVTINGFGTVRTLVVGAIDGAGSGPRYVRAAGASIDSGINWSAVTKVEPTGQRTEAFNAAAGLALRASIKLPGVTFERAGTGVMTRIVIIDKADSVQNVDRDWSDIEDINAFFERIREASMPERAKRKDAAPAQAAPAARSAPAATAEAAPAIEGLVEHTTQKGKIIRGIVRTDLTKDAAQKIDPYTFKKDGGWFIREKYVKGDGSFSRAQPGMGSNIRDVNRVADRVRKAFPNAPQINVLPSSQYAPADLREFMAAEGMLNEADGVFWGGEVWVFANKMASPARAEWVMLHEFGHAGVRALYPMEIERRAVFARMLASNPDLQARVARLMEGRPEVQDMVDAVDEVLADTAASGERPSWLMEIVAWLRRHLRKLGLVNAYSDNDILSIVAMGRDRLRRGDRGSLAGSFSRAEPSPRQRQQALLSQEPVNVPRNDALRTAPPREARKIGRELYRPLQALRSDDAVQTVDGRRVGFGLAGFHEIANHSADRRVLEIIPSLPAILRDAVPLWSEAPRTVSAGGARAFHYYARKARFFDGEAIVTVLVREDGNGNFFYDADATSITALEAVSAPAAPASLSPNQARDTVEPNEGRLLQWWAEVNRREEGHFSRAGTDAVAPPVRLAPAGIVDAALRVPMQALGVDKLTRNAGRALTDMLAKYIPERVKAGVVDDFGLGEVYTDRRALMYGQQRKGLREAKNFYDRVATVSREEAAVLYAAANNADADQVEAMIANLSEEGQKVLREVKQRVQDMGREQVRLGLLSAAAFERNQWAYLHRSYKKYELEQTEKVRQRRGRAIQVWGDAYIGRGLFDSVDPAKLQGRGWFGTSSRYRQADKQVVGQKFIRLERRANSGEGVMNLPGIEGSKKQGRLLEAVYWKADEPIPSQYADFEQAGVWQARDTKGAKVVMWRDFTPDERKKMGEIDDFRYAMLKTLHFATHNVEVGRFLEWVADTQAVPDEDRLPAGAEVREANESLSVTYGRDVWVQVPMTNAGGSKTRKYGKLAGQFVPGPVWNDLRQIVRTQHIQPFGELYADVLRFWKVSKTALSPVVHMNNVVSNIVMADWHDVTARDIITGLRTYLRRDTDAAAKTAFEDFEDAGGTQGLYVLSEIQKDQLEPLLEALEAQLDEAGEARGQVGVLAALQFAMTGRLSDALSAATSSRPGKGVQKGAKLMMDMYEAEDTVFRFSAYLKALEQGLTSQEAAKIARRSFLDYSINAPWIQLMRNTAFPFVSFVYRAIPMLWDVMQNKPWKLAKLALMIGAANALGYAMSGGDEDRERALLPEELSGRVLGVIAPKLVRMPWNDQHGSPVYLDIRRWIPVGDIVDTGATNSAFPILPAMMPGGPLMMLGELLLNQSAFTGREITKESDTLTERGTKVAEHLYKAMAPNFPGLPGTWSTEAIVNAANGRTDAFGREVASVPAAALGAIGVKARSYPIDQLALNAQTRLAAQSREINAEIRALARQAGRRGITSEEFEEGRADALAKLRELELELRGKLERALGP